MYYSLRFYIILSNIILHRISDSGFSKKASALGSLRQECLKTAAREPLPLLHKLLPVREKEPCVGTEFDSMVSRAYERAYVLARSHAYESRKIVLGLRTPCR